MRLVSIDELFWQDASQHSLVLFATSDRNLELFSSLSLCRSRIVFICSFARHDATHPSIPLWTVERIRRVSRCCAISPRMRYVNNMAACGERGTDKLGKKYSLSLAII